MMYLLDTNIFLEILLKQGKSDLCKQFLSEHYGEISISDFSLHSIGVILFRRKKQDIFLDFVRDVISKVDILSLPVSEYQFSLQNILQSSLDFDDFYQYRIARYWGLDIVTMDSDFKRISDVNVLFL